jgi:hypothetical protein
MHNTDSELQRFASKGGDPEREMGNILLHVLSRDTTISDLSP